MLTKPKLIAQERFDLEDLSYLLSASDNDQKRWLTGAWSTTAYVVNGFAVSTGTGLATVTIAGSTLINPENTGAFSWFVGPATAAAVSVSLSANTRNYLELQIYSQDGTPLTRAFWDQTANQGAGSEFNQTTNTTTDLMVQVNVNTTGFTGSANTLPLCFIDTDSGNNVKILKDRRNLFFELAQPGNGGYTWPWTNQSGLGPTLTLTGGSGTYVAGETVTFTTGATATVVTGGTTSIVVYNLSSSAYASGDTVTGGTSGAARTLSTLIDPWTGADKSLFNLKSVLAAIQTEILSIKGTSRWYNSTPGSITAALALINSTIVPSSTASTAKWSWSGSALSITDTNGSPASTDNIAQVRVFGNSSTLNLRRADGQASTSTIAIADGSVLFVTLPTAGTNQNFSGSGSGAGNYQTATRASFTSNGSNYWIAYREGTTVTLRNGLTLLSGESADIDDADSVSLLANLGMTGYATSPNYSSGTYGVSNGDIRGVAGEALVTRIGKLTAAMGDYQEDRSAMLSSTSVVTWNGSSLSFASDITLTVNNTKSGTAYTITITTANSPIALSDGDFAYISITRGANANATPVLNSGTPIPAQTQANKDVFVLFKRVGTDLLIPLHKQVLVSGNSVKLGTAPGPAAARAYPTYFLSPAGNGDGTTFTAALAALPAAGGVILLMDAISVGASVTLPHNVKVIGRDENAIITFAASAGFIVSGAQVVLEDLSITGTSGSTALVSVTGGSCIIDHCYFANPAGQTLVCVALNSDFNSVEDCTFTGVLGPGLGTGIQYGLGFTNNTEQNSIYTP